MEKRFFLAITLSITVFLLWSHFFAPPPIDGLPQEPPAGQVSSQPQSSGISPQSIPETNVTPGDVVAFDEIAEATPAPEQRTILIESSSVIAELDTKGAKISSWRLKDYDGVEGQPIELISPEDPLFHPGELRINGQAAFNDQVFFADVTDTTVFLDDENPEFFVTLSAQLPSGEFLQKSFTFYHDKYMVNLDVTLSNRGKAAIGGKIEYLLPDKIVEPLQQGATNRYIRSGPTFWDGHSRERPKTEKITTQLMYPGVRWAALQESYFFAGLAPITQLATGFIEPGKLMKDSERPETTVAGLILDSQGVAVGDSIMQRVFILLGPKKYDDLLKLGIGIENIVEFGWIEFLGKFFYYILINSVVYLKNYGVGIILITVGVKLILFPLSHKQMQSMKKMQAIQPQMKAIQEKYRKEPQKQQQELGLLYKKHGVNPMGGCLPMLIQFPIFIALYQVLMNLIEMRGASFLWVNDLSQPNVAMVLIMGVSMIVQQKMTPVSGDPRQAKIMMMLPIIFTAMFWNFPSGLVLYWLTNNVLTIGQQYVMNRLNEKTEIQEPKMKARVRRKLGDKNDSIGS